MTTKRKGAIARSSATDQTGAVHGAMDERHVDLETNNTELPQTTSQRRDWAGAARLLRTRLKRITLNKFAANAKPDRFSSLAKAQLEHGDYDAAEATYAAMIKHHPDYGYGYAGLAQVSQRRQDWAEAIRRWRVCLDRFATRSHPGWFSAAAKAHLALGNMNAAESCYESLVKHHPNHGIGLAGLAQVSALRQDLATATTRWQVCLAQSNTPVLPSWFAAAAGANLALNRLDEAEAAYGALAANQPDSPAGTIGLAKVAALRDDWFTSAELWNSAATGFGAALTLSDQLYRVDVLAHAGDFSAANAAVDAVIKEAPDLPAGWIKRAVIAGIERKETKQWQRWKEADSRFPVQVEDDPTYRLYRSRSMNDFSIFEVRKASRASDPREAAIHVKLLSSNHFRIDALDWARNYSEKYVDSIEVQLTLAQQLEINMDELGDIGELVAVTGEIRDRFPESRAAWVSHIRAHIRNFDTSAAKEAVDHLIHRFGRSAMSDCFNGWLAQTNGDHAGARRWSERIASETFRFAIDGPISQLERIDSNPLPDFTDKILLFCTVKNECVLLPWMFEYYRSIGIDWFFIIDNDSDDGSAALACRQCDASVYWTNDSFDRANGGMQWVNELMERHGSDNWCIYVDADEQLVVPGLESNGLRAVLDDMREQGHEAMGGFMLDMYPDTLKAVASFGPGDDPLSATPFFDLNHLFMGHWEAPYRWVRGGARYRLFGTAVMLTKVPIVRGGHGIRYIGNHETTAARMSEVTCALLHYKILRDSLTYKEPGSFLKDPRIIKRNPICRQRHNRYHDLYDHIGNAYPLRDKQSKKFESSDQLIRLGLIDEHASKHSVPRYSSSRVRRWMSQAKRPGKSSSKDGPWPDAVPCYRGFTSCVMLAQAALRFRDWETAAARWTACIEQFPELARPSWFAALGEALLGLDRVGKAETAFRKALERDPDLPDGHAGLARTAMWRQKWEKAIEHWRKCFDRASGATRVDWLQFYAGSLLNGGHTRQARALYREIASDDWHAVRPTGALTDALVAARNFNGIVKEYRSGLLSGSTFADNDLKLINQLVLKNGLRQARVIYDLIKDKHISGLTCNHRRSVIARLFSDSERPRQWRDLELAAAKHLSSATDDREVVLLTFVRLSALLALRDYDAFKACAADLPDANHCPKSLRPFIDFRRRLGTQADQDGGTGRVFGIGLSKTGTKSLALALETLGYSTVHWSNPVTREIISDDDLPLFDAFIDTPVSFQFERLYDLFPKAKFIYTTRPIESWLVSFANHISTIHDCKSFDELSAIVKDPENCRHGEEFRVIHNNLYSRHTDAEEAYRYHDARVKSFFTSEREHQFSKFDVFTGDGWEALCRFLQKPQPQIPFPWANKTVKT